MSYIVQLWAFLKGTVVNVFVKFPTFGSTKLQLHGERQVVFYPWYMETLQWEHLSWFH